MEFFSIGILSLIFMLLFPFMYFAGYCFRYIGTWATRENPPKDRVLFFIIVMAILGFIAGSVGQPLWNKGRVCKESGQAVLPCVLFSNESSHVFDKVWLKR